jgi:Spy/CpxP family protein refolding chaperone
MSRLTGIAAVVLLFAPQLAAAQPQQPYAGLETRPIKALSEQQIADLRAGRGMGLALAAELNGYPGPVHVIELAQPLGLSDTQRAKVQSLFDAMKAETVPLGQKLIVQEADLDRQFASKTITEHALAASIHAIAGTQAALRTAHLKYHLAALGVLTPAQTKQYAELRGYAGDTQAQHQHGGHRH